MLNVQDYGAAGDGEADDTAALQGCLDEFAESNTSGAVYFPAGVYKVTSTLVYRGGSPYGVRLLGDTAAAGPDGAVIHWAGPKGGTVLSLLGANETVVEGLAIDGGQLAACAVSIAFDGDRTVPACDVTLNRLILGGIAGANSAAVRLGMMPDGVTPDTRQCNHILIDRCAMIGSPGASVYGVITGAANVKNFAIRDCKIGGFETGIYHGSSGFLVVDGLEAYGNTTSDVVGFNGAMAIRSLESEGSGRLFYGVMSGNPGSVTIEDSLWYSAATAVDDMVIVYGGSIRLHGCHLYNNRTPTALPKVCVFINPTSCPTLSSYGNYFQNASGTIPAVDLSGKSLTTPPNPYPKLPALVASFGDYGGAPPNLQYLKPIVP